MDKLFKQILNFASRPKFVQPISFIDKAVNQNNALVGYKPCFDNKCVVTKYDSEYNAYSIEYILENLPYINLAIDTKLNLIMGGGLKINNPDLDIKFADWLVTANTEGSTNLSEIREAIRDYIVFGKGYLYQLSDLNLKKMDLNSIHPIVADNPAEIGMRMRLGYFVTKKSKAKIDLDEILKRIDITTSTPVEFENGYFLPNDKVIAITDSNIRSPLTVDRLRMQLILDAYLQNITDINSENTEKIALWLKDNIAPEVLGFTAEQVALDPSEFQIKLGQVIESIKDGVQTAVTNTTQRNRPLILNKQLIEEMATMPKSNTSFSYLNYLQSESMKLSASLMSINPVLMGEREAGLSSSVKDVIDFTVETIIEPIQSHISAIFTSVLYSQFKLGIKDEIVLVSSYSSGMKEKVETEKVIIDNTKELIGAGVPTETAYNYLNGYIALEMGTNENLRLFQSNLQNLDQSIT